MSKVFVYGTLKKGFCNEPLLEAETFLGKCHTTAPIFRLYEVKGHYPFPALLTAESNGCKVFGELYDVREQCMTLLDQLEGVSQGLYERIQLDVTTLSGRLESEVTAYRYCHDRKDCDHVGAVWPATELSRWRFADKQFVQQDVQEEVVGVALWDTDNEKWATPTFESTEELESYVSPRRKKFGGSDHTLWLGKWFTSKSRKMEVTRRHLFILSEDQVSGDVPHFAIRHELAAWASTNLKFFGGDSGEPVDWRKVLSEAVPIVDVVDEEYDSEDRSDGPNGTTKAGC